MTRLSGAPWLLAGGALFAMFATACPGIGTNEFTYISEIPAQPTWCNSIETIVVGRCGSCHGAQPANGAPGRFRLDVYDGGDTPGAGLLARSINSRTHNAGLPMPPTGLIPQIERDAIELWLELGAVECGPISDDVGVDADTSDVGEDAASDVGIDTTPTMPTLTMVSEQVFSLSCAVPTCHLGADAPWGLDLSDDGGLMDRLGGSSADGVPYIVDGMPDESLLYLLITDNAASVDDARGLMPFGGPALPQDDIDLVRDWIIALTSE